MNDSNKNNGRFVKGFIPWNKGKMGIYSEETLQKIRNARAKQVFPPNYSETMRNSCLGKKQTEETKRKISEARKAKFGRDGFLNSPEARKHISESMIKSERFQSSVKSRERRKKITESMMGHLVSENTRNKLRLILSGRKRSEETSKKIRFALSLRTEEQKTASIIKMMKTNARNRKSCVSKIEKEVLDIIETTMNCKIERQFRIGRKYYDGRIGNILIEIDGIHWHSSPEALERDKIKDDLAKENGFIVLRIRAERRISAKAIMDSKKDLIYNLLKAI